MVSPDTFDDWGTRWTRLVNGNRRRFLFSGWGEKLLPMCVIYCSVCSLMIEALIDTAPILIFA
jgi:hypothetical protein